MHNPMIEQPSRDQLRERDRHKFGLTIDAMIHMLGSQTGLVFLAADATSKAVKARLFKPCEHGGSEFTPQCSLSEPAIAREKQAFGGYREQ
jgi:hypothetical protein